jgi:hypothetical protein
MEFLRGSDRRGSGDCVRQERIGSNYMKGSGSCSLTMRFREELDHPF